MYTNAVDLYASHSKKERSRRDTGIPAGYSTPFTSSCLRMKILKRKRSSPLQVTRSADRGKEEA